MNLLAIILIPLLTLSAGCSCPHQATNQNQNWFGNSRNPAADLSGEWTWHCCHGTYSGEMTLRQEGDRIVGTFRDFSVGSGGTLAGTVRNNFLSLSRSLGDTTQNLALAVSPDGATLTGIIGSTSDSVWSEMFEARRK